MLQIRQLSNQTCYYKTLAFHEWIHINRVSILLSVGVMVACVNRDSVGTCMRRSRFTSFTYVPIEISNCVFVRSRCRCFMCLSIKIQKFNAWLAVWFEAETPRTSSWVMRMYELSRIQ